MRSTVVHRVPPACPWCEAPLGGRDERRPGRITCPSCGAQATQPWPTEAELEQAYGSWYRPISGRFTGPLDRVLRWSRGRLARRVDSMAPAGPVLDVGSGDGPLLDALRAAGRDALGLERVSTRPDVLEGDIAELQGRFAAVVFWHSLEHLRRPGRALRHATRLLEARGVLFVAIPNPQSLQARLFGERWLALDLPRHLVHLPASTLAVGVEDAGLQVTRVSHWRGGQVLFGMLHGLVGLLPGHPDLYVAIRRSEARRQPMRPGARAAAIAGAALLSPAAVLLAGLEIALRRGGSVYLEARRPDGSVES